jgi:hypothetical protein
MTTHRVGDRSGVVRRRAVRRTVVRALLTSAALASGPRRPPAPAPDPITASRDPQRPHPYQGSAPGLVSAGSHRRPAQRCTAGDRCEPLGSDGVWTKCGPDARSWGSGLLDRLDSNHDPWRMTSAADEIGEPPALVGPSAMTYQRGARSCLDEVLHHRHPSKISPSAASSIPSSAPMTTIRVRGARPFQSSPAAMSTRLPTT